MSTKIFQVVQRSENNVTVVASFTDAKQACKLADKLNSKLKLVKGILVEIQETTQQ